MGVAGLGPFWFHSGMWIELQPGKMPFREWVRGREKEAAGELERQGQTKKHHLTLSLEQVQGSLDNKGSSKIRRIGKS